MAPAKYQETWVDWLPEGFGPPPPEEQITRAEMIAQVQALLARTGDTISEWTIRNWEGQGLIPGPVRRLQDGAVRAFYPHWMPDVAVGVYINKRRGDDPEIIREIARDFVQRNLINDLIRQSDAVQKMLPEAIDAFVDAYVAMGGEPPAEVAIQLKRADGRIFHEYGFKLKAPPGAE